MPLPASVPTGTVSGTWYTPSGNLAVGEIIFLLTHEIEIPDDADGVVIPVRYEVPVSAGQLNVTLPAGFYNTFVSLNDGYRKPKVIQVVASQNLNLPDAIGVVPPSQLVTPVRSVNNQFPDASGNITITGSGGVTNPGISVDNAITRFDGVTGQVIQSSGVTLDDTDQVSGVGAVVFDPVTSPTYQRGKLVYSDNADAEALTWFNVDSEVELHLGRELQIPVRNTTGSAITAGQAVYINGNHSGTGLPTIGLARADSFSTARCVGLTAHAIENNTNGYVYAVGLAHHNINTAAFSNGDTLYLSASSAGAVTATPPSSPNYQVRVGVVTRASAGNGAVYVTTGARLLGNGTANQVMAMNGTGTSPVYKTLAKSDVGLSNVDNTSDANKPISTATQAALDAKKPVKAFGTTGKVTGTFGPGDTSGAWTVAPAQWRVTVPAAVGDVLSLDPSVIAQVSADAEMDVCSLNGNTPLRFYSSGTSTQGANGHGGLYMGTQFSAKMGAIKWVVTADDIVSGNVTLSYMFRSGAGITWGSGVYPNEITLVNEGTP